MLFVILIVIETCDCRSANIARHSIGKREVVGLGISLCLGKMNEAQPDDSSFACRKRKKTERFSPEPRSSHPRNCAIADNPVEASVELPLGPVLSLLNKGPIGKGKWSVEEVFRKFRKNKETFYEVKWEGYPSTENSAVPESRVTALVRK